MYCIWRVPSFCVRPDWPQCIYSHSFITCPFEMTNKTPSQFLIFCEWIQVNLCQKLLFLHQLTHNMTTDCSLKYEFNRWKFQAQTWGEHVVYRNCFWHSEQFLYTICSPHVVQKEELLTKNYLYNQSKCTAKLCKFALASNQDQKLLIYKRNVQWHLKVL